MTGDSSQDLPPELAAPRTRFLAELGERLGALRQSLAKLGAAAESAGELNALRRRVHALAAAADVLRFSRAAEALAMAEAGLAGAGGWDPGPVVRGRVARILDLLPSLVLDIPLDLTAELDRPASSALREPLCVVVYGDASLESLLPRSGTPQSIECHATRQPDQALELVSMLSPDILLVDGDDAELSELLPRLRQAAGARQIAIVAVGSFEREEQLRQLIGRGVSLVLPKPTDASTLERCLRQLSVTRESRPLRAAASLRQVSTDELIAAITAEARRAFRDPALPEPGPSLEFASNAEVQAALWSAFARLRSLASQASGGALTLPREGPSGALVLAPDAPVAGRPGSSSPASSPVPLTGRRLVVADDDGPVRTLLSNAFSELGATVLQARDGAEALELAEKHWPDALISDTLMPGLDGFELCRRIREDIALSDLPVLLVAWKEHLLARTRSTVNPSIPALGQLDGASLAAALRDCLAPRSALEQRLAQHDAVHGRLDGLTPRLLLQMVCNRSPNALLSLRSGAVSFEFSISDGRPVHARWYKGEVLHAEGQLVLVPFLGVRTGRFSVEPLFSPPVAHFEGEVMAVLNPAAIRMRHAREQLGPRQLGVVREVVLEPLATEQYLDSAPAGRDLVSQLVGPGVLQRLVAEDAASREPGRLHELLADLARHGAIAALTDRDGHDLLPGGSKFWPGAARRSSRPPSSAMLQGSPASTPASRASSRPASTPATSGSNGERRATSAAPSGALELGQAVLQAVSDPQPAAAPASPKQERSAQPEPGRDEPPPSETQPTGQPRAQRSEPPAAVPSASSPAAAQTGAQTTVPDAAAPTPATEGTAAASAADSASDAPAAATVSAASSTDVAPPATELAPEPARPRSDLDPPRDEPGEEDEPFFPGLQSTASEPSDAPGESSEGAWGERRNVETASDGEPNREDSPNAPGSSRGTLAEAYAAGQEPDSAWPPRPGARLRAVLVPAALTLGAALLAFVAIRGLASRTWDAPERGAGNPALTPAPEAQLQSAAARPPAPLDAGLPGRSSERQLPAETPPAAAEVSFESELLDLPPATKLPPGHGLLEVRNLQRERIYVDGVFMGNYENRLVPLAPGTYQLRSSDGVRDLEHSVEVKAGRRTRVSAQPKSSP